ncbi:hypothetical protein EYF80_016377 [Liparis tanakae]|uniref:Uncharacterized protein n=1 Tax=Liparis tanakae TaxID=230148 RepID=A0A4Z2I8J0_9TELE|nr:hypothetical protein EYF80_016377 [Liparis tanakae]
MTKRRSALNSLSLDDGYECTGPETISLQYFDGLIVHLSAARAGRSSLNRPKQTVWKEIEGFLKTSNAKLRLISVTPLSFCLTWAEKVVDRMDKNLQFLFMCAQSTSVTGHKQPWYALVCRGRRHVKKRRPQGVDGWERRRGVYSGRKDLGGVHSD